MASVGALILVGLVCVALGVILFPMVYGWSDSIEKPALRWTATVIGFVVVAFVLLAVVGTLLPEGL